MVLFLMNCWMLGCFFVDVLMFFLFVLVVIVILVCILLLIWIMISFLFLINVVLLVCGYGVKLIFLLWFNIFYSLWVMCGVIGFRSNKIDL